VRYRAYSTFSHSKVLFAKREAANYSKESVDHEHIILASYRGGWLAGKSSVLMVALWNCYQQAAVLLRVRIYEACISLTKGITKKETYARSPFTPTVLALSLENYPASLCH
jgi:hypothetical protein